MHGFATDKDGRVLAGLRDGSPVRVRVQLDGARPVQPEQRRINVSSVQVAEFLTDPGKRNKVAVGAAVTLQNGSDSIHHSVIRGGVCGLAAEFVRDQRVHQLRLTFTAGRQAAFPHLRLQLGDFQLHQVGPHLVAAFRLVDLR